MAFCYNKPTTETVELISQKRYVSFYKKKKNMTTDILVDKEAVNEDCKNTLGPKHQTITDALCQN